MTNAGVIRLERNGPTETGLSRLELDPDDFQSELPEQEWHIYFADEKLGLNVGVWTTSSMQEAFGPYPGDEFMFVLEGRVKLLDGNDNQTIVEPGQTFFVRNGIPVSWKQEGFCRKFFMTFLSPDAPEPQIETTDGGITILQEATLAPLMESSEDGSKDAVAFTNDSGNMSTGMWESEPFESGMFEFPTHELARILRGEVSITTSDGTVHKFIEGDVFFIEKGTVCSWKADAKVRKFYCTLEP